MGYLTKITKEYFGDEKRKEGLSVLGNAVYDWIKGNGVKFIPVTDGDGNTVEVADRNFLAKGVNDHKVSYNNISTYMTGENGEIDVNEMFGKDDSGFEPIDSDLLYGLITKYGKYTDGGSSITCSVGGNDIVFPLTGGDTHSASYLCSGYRCVSVFDNGKDDKGMVYNTKTYAYVKPNENVFIRLIKKPKGE